MPDISGLLIIEVAVRNIRCSAFRRWIALLVRVRRDYTLWASSQMIFEEVALQPHVRLFGDLLEMTLFFLKLCLLFIVPGFFLLCFRLDKHLGFAFPMCCGWAHNFLRLEKEKVYRPPRVHDIASVRSDLASHHTYESCLDNVG